MLIARGIPRARALRYVNMLVSGDAVEPGCVCERTRAITSATARPSLSTSFNGLAGQKHRYITAEYVRVAPGMRPVLRQTASSAPMSRLVGGVIQQRRAAAAGRRRNSSRCVSATSNTHTPRTLGTYLFMWGRERVSDTQGAAAAGATRRCTGRPAGFDRPPLVLTPELGRTTTGLGPRNNTGAPATYAFVPPTPRLRPQAAASKRPTKLSPSTTSWRQRPSWTDAP